MSDQHATSEANGLRVEVSNRGPTRTVRLIGELDLASASQAIDACVLGGPLHVEVDLAGLSFMDCSGFGALVSARRALLSRDGSLRWINAVAQPARLLDLLDPEFDRRFPQLGDPFEDEAAGQ